MDNAIHWIQAHVLTLLLASPAAASVIMMALPRAAKLAVRLTAAIASGATVLIAGYLFFAYDRGAGGIQFIEKVAWVPQLGLSYHLGVDGIGISLVVLTAFIISTGSFASWTVEHRTKEFYAALFALVTGVFGVFVAMDLFFFFLFYEIAVLPMYLLIGIWGTGPKEYAALKLTLYLLVGSAFVLVGLFGIYFYADTPRHTFDFIELSRSGGFNLGLQRIIFVLLYVGFGILAGIWPLHTWSPDGHASAPTAVSMLHAGVLMKLGAYGVLRIGVGLLPAGAQFWAPLVGGIAVVNILYGAMSAMGQTDLKYVIAYSSVSHMGVVMLGIATLNAVGLNGSVFQMFSHGIMTGLFFALVGLVYEKAHTRDMPSMGGFASRMPGIAAAFTIGGLASFGVPGTSGFVAELLVFLGAWRAGGIFTYLAIFAVFGIVVTATYVLRVLQRVFLGPFKEHYEGLPDARTTEWVALVVLAALLILLGVFPGPMISLIDTAIRSFVP